MNPAVISIIVAVALTGLVFGFALAFFLKRRDKSGGEIIMLQSQLNEIKRTMDLRLGESTKVISDHVGSSFKLIKDVTERLTKLDETNRQVVGFADQLQSLQNILKNPKQRGILGEYYLETLLKNAFSPKQYQMQYKFKNGDIVDAALFLGDKIIPIDSKFSLENYNRIVEENDPVQKERLEKIFVQDLKNRIEETAKYVRPQEGTLEFAFMFIPAEGIYYDLLVNQIGALKVNTRDLIDYAIKEKHVHIVSPTTFYVTLQALLHGMRAYQIQESTKEVIKNVSLLGKHIEAYEEYFIRLGNNLGTTVNAYNTAHKELEKIDKDVLRISGESMGIEPKVLDKPAERE
ncbi:MAG: DNA recombination protein RmuC [Candidatus Niyogibacteria bacterium]|nr:DNA recombination protein RmuC [Candidatus Niyogibacteria bacterium]